MPAATNIDACNRGKIADSQPNREAASTSCLSCRKIDVSRYVAEMDYVLHNTDDWNARIQALAILRRWRFDEMLDDASRQRAKVLSFRFAPDEWENH